MMNRFTRKLSFGKKALLAAAGLLAMAGPIAIGMLRTAAYGQTAPNAAESATDRLPEFEVASIKPTNPEGMHRTGLTVYPGGRVIIPTVTLKSLVATAFHISYSQISGGDAWTENQTYDIEAKAPENLRSEIKDLRHSLFDIEDANLRKMLQALLIDRFQLKYHREARTGDVYLLERNGKTLRLTPSESTPARSDPSQRHTTFGSIGYARERWGIFNTSMQQLAKFAGDYVVRAPVLDRTELSGSFEYRQPEPDDEPAYTGQLHSDSFMNMLSVVGLKLERTKGPVEHIVIDSAARPSAN